MNIRRLLPVLLAFFLVADTIYSGFQHYHEVLDGDMAAIALPSPGYRRVLQDPLGFGILMHGEEYGGAGRFFAHASTAAFLRVAPAAFRLVASPITSLYLSCALIKVITQALLIFLIAAYASGTTRVRDLRFLIAASLVAPLFLTTAFDGHMNIVDPSPAYVFFYGFAFAALLAFFLPLYLRWMHPGRRPLRAFEYILLGLFAIVVVFNGPLNVPVLLLVSGILVARQIWVLLFARGGKLRLLPQPVLLLACWCLLLCVYNYWLGRHNIENVNNETMSVTARYGLLLRGIYEFFIAIDGCLVLLLLIIVNGVILYRMREDEQARRNLKLLRWFALLSVLYLALLPLGGYRPYRPYILKKDLAIPVMVLLLLFWAVSASYILTHARGISAKAYLVMLLPAMLWYLKIDDRRPGRDYCQREAIKLIRDAPAQPVLIPGDCTVLTWDKVINPQDSRMAAEALQFWHITPEPKLFYQK